MSLSVHLEVPRLPKLQWLSRLGALGIVSTTPGNGQFDKGSGASRDRRGLAPWHSPLPLGAIPRVPRKQSFWSIHTLDRTLPGFGGSHRYLESVPLCRQNPAVARGNLPMRASVRKRQRSQPRKAEGSRYARLFLQYPCSFVQKGPAVSHSDVDSFLADISSHPIRVALSLVHSY